MKKLFLLFSLVGVLAASGQVERVTVDSATREVTNTGAVNFAAGLLKVNGVSVVGGSGGSGGGAVDSVNGQTGVVVIEVAPAVLVKHIDGTSTTYPLSANNDTARGTALLAAAATLVTGDTLEIGAGTFALGSSQLIFPDGVYAVQGAGHGNTIITSTSANQGATVKPGSGNTIRGLTINSSTNPIGWLTLTYGQTAATTCTLIDIETISGVDGFHFVGNTSFDLTMIDCIGVSTWDVLTVTGTGTMTITTRNCKFTGTTPNTGQSRPVWVRNTGSNATVNMFGGEITSTYSGSPALPSASVVSEISTGGIYLHDVKVRSNGSGQSDVSGTTVYVSGGSGSGTGGAFTIDTGSVNYLGAALLNTPATFTNLSAVNSSTTGTNTMMLLTGTGAVATALTLTDSTAASLGVQIPSPGLTWAGRGYKTDATAGSRTVSFRSYVQPVQGASNPSGIWELDAVAGGGSPSNVFKIFSDGNIQPTTGYLASDGTAGATATTGGGTFRNGLYTSGAIGADAAGLTTGRLANDRNTLGASFYDNAGTSKLALDLDARKFFSTDGETEIIDFTGVPVLSVAATTSYAPVVKQGLLLGNPDGDQSYFDDHGLFYVDAVYGVTDEGGIDIFAAKDPTHTAYIRLNPGSVGNIELHPYGTGKVLINNVAAATTETGTTDAPAKYTAANTIGPSIEGTDYYRVTGTPAFGKVPVFDSEDGVSWQYINGSTAKVYRALLTQSGADAPVATVLENTLGGTLVWGYDDTGHYTGTLAGAFTESKTFLQHGDPVVIDDESIIYFGRGSSDVVTLETHSIDLVHATHDAINGLLTNTSVTILVYP